MHYDHNYFFKKQTKTINNPSYNSDSDNVGWNNMLPFTGNN